MKTDRQSVEANAASIAQIIAYRYSLDDEKLPIDIRECLLQISADMLALLAEKEAAEAALEAAHDVIYDGAHEVNDLRTKLADAEAARDASQVDVERYRYMRANATFVDRNGPEFRWLLPRRGRITTVFRFTSSATPFSKTDSSHEESTVCVGA